jgi:predicted aconitase with swiveling domain
MRMTGEEPQGGVLKLQGRIISRGIASGKALISQHKISFLGGVDPLTGIIVDQSVDICGECIANRVLIFPGGKGSTVGSYVIYQLKQHGKAPAAMVTRSAGTIVAAGAIIAEIPVVDSLERDPIEGGLITDGMAVLVNGDEGYIEVR